MKHFLAMATIVLLVLTVHNASGGPVTPEGEPIEIADNWTNAKDLLDYTCKGKGIVTGFAITQRGMMTEEEVLASLKLDWEESYKPAGVPFATYVDMQRIIRDVMRKHRDGTWVRHWEDDVAIRNYMSQELITCYANGW